MKRVGMILSGCGVMDGSEIHEATLSILYLDKEEATLSFFAPDKQQRDVIDHFGQNPMEEKRNVLKESARIARGNIKPLSEINLDELDAIVLPGGFGAAKNLCSYAVDGPDCTIDQEVSETIQKALEKVKVIGCMCIAPVLVARALKDTGARPKLTIGTDEKTMQHLKQLGAEPVQATVFEAVTDEKNKIVSTPAYMLGSRISDVAEGIEKMAKKVMELCG